MFAGVVGVAAPAPPPGAPPQAALVGNAPQTVGDASRKPANTPQPLTWPEAARRVREQNPALAAAAKEPLAIDGRTLQAGLKPNPELSVEVENFAGTHDVGVFSSTEATVQYSRLIERGGKRAARVGAAEAERRVAELEVEARQADLLAEAARAFVDLLSAQQRLANRETLAGLAERILETVRVRVEAGKASPVEETRATVTLAAARCEVEKTRGEIRVAADRLAGLWGEAASDFSAVLGGFRLPPLPAAEPPASLGENPERRRAEAELAARQAALVSEEASRHPDFTVSGGVRYLQEGRGTALVGGLSIPLATSDKRQGAIAEAKIRVEKAGAEIKALESGLRSAWRQARLSLDLAIREGEALKGTILPGSAEALVALQEGYRQGKFDFLAVLDAQRTHVELEARAIDVVTSGLKAAVELRRLTAGHGSNDPFSFLSDKVEVVHE